MIQGNARCNLSALALFTQSLDYYESSLPSNIVEPSMFSEAGRNLEMGLNRLISANYSDSYQMMRILMRRILEKRAGYSSYMLLMVSTASPSGLFKDHVMTIVQPLLYLMEGKTFSIDDSYFAKLGRNEGIRAFMESYPSSDISTIYNTMNSDLVIANSSIIEMRSSEDRLQIELGTIDADVTLIGGTNPILTFNVSKDITIPQDHHASQKLTITANVLISPRTKEFTLSKQIKFTEGAAKALSLFGCTQYGYSPFNDTVITVPGNFFACKLEVFSIDSGNTWMVGNIIIVPPMRGRM